MTRTFHVRAGAQGLQAVELGDLAAPAVVLAHGVGSSPRFIQEAFGGPLEEAGWRLVTYALRGHQGSTPVEDPAGHDLDAQVADLDAVIRAAHGPVDVVGGVSLGGHIAVRWAATRRWEGALLACLPAWTGTVPAGSGPHAVVADEVRRVGVPGMLARLRASKDLQPWLRDTLLRDLASHDPASLTAALLALDGGCGPSTTDLQALAGPLVCVGWPDDPGHPLEVAEQWVSLAPRGHLEVIALSDLKGSRRRLGEAAVQGLRLSVGGPGRRIPDQPVP